MKFKQGDKVKANENAPEWLARNVVFRVYSDNGTVILDASSRENRIAVNRDHIDMVQPQYLPRLGDVLNQKTSRLFKDVVIVHVKRDGRDKIMCSGEGQVIEFDDTTDLLKYCDPTGRNVFDEARKEGEHQADMKWMNANDDLVKVKNDHITELNATIADLRNQLDKIKPRPISELELDKGDKVMIEVEFVYLDSDGDFRFVTLSSITSGVRIDVLAGEKTKAIKL